MAKMSSSKEVAAKNKGTRRKTQGVFKPEHESRIVRVSRNAGSKDRHSKVRTFKGLRDRRVRLSVDTAINFYDLQDRLGVEHPSDAIDWLIQTAKSSIDELRPLPTDMGSVSQITYSDGSPDEQSKKAKEISNNSSGSEGSVKPCGESCSTSKMASRDRARQNARERTKRKKDASASASVSVSQVSQQQQVLADFVFPFKNPQQSYSFGREEERGLTQNIHMLDTLLPHSYQELLLSRDLPASLVSSSAAVPRGFSTYMSSQDMDFGSLPCVQAKPRQLGYINSTQVHSHVKNVGHDQIRNVSFSSKMEPEEMDVEQHIQIRNSMSFSGKVEGDGMSYGVKNGEMQLGSGSSSSSFYLKNGMDMGATDMMRMYNNINSMSMRRGPLQSNEKSSTTAPAGSAEIIKEYCQEEEDEEEHDNRLLQSVCNIGHHHGYPPCSQ